MSHDRLRALMEHAEETGCVNLSAFTQVLSELELEEEEVSALYEHFDEGGIELTPVAARSSYASSCQDRT